MNFNKLWCEKYRPTTLQTILLEDSVRSKIAEYSAAGEIPNLLFCGPPGQGKTSLARIIVNELLDCQYLYINASDENGIDTIRSKVSGFAQTKSIDGALKVVILDEADYITAQGQAALRNTMETFSDTCRFILTANIKHKIVPAIQSRCTGIDIVPPLKEAAIMCFDILKKEGINVAQDDKGSVVALIRKAYPDLRKVINELQKSIVDGEIKITLTGVSDAFCSEILQKCEDGKHLKAREYIIQNEAEFNGDYPQLLKQLLESLFTSDIADDKKKRWCLVIAEHLYRTTFVVDQEINCFACLLQLT